MLSQGCALGLSVFPNRVSCWGWEQKSKKRIALSLLPSGGGHALHLTAHPFQCTLKSCQLGWAHWRIKPPFLRIWSHFQSGTEVRALQLPQKPPKAGLHPTFRCFPLLRSWVQMWMLIKLPCVFFLLSIPLIYVVASGLLILYFKFNFYFILVYGWFTMLC